MQVYGDAWEWGEGAIFKRHNVFQLPLMLGVFTLTFNHYNLTSMWVTSGIHGGYRLVSIYDLLDSKPKGGYYLPSQNSKCQDLPKFQFSGEGVVVMSAKSKLKVPRSA